MRKFISAKLAGNIVLGIYGLVVIFHILVLAQVVPSDIVWGRQIGNDPHNLVALETIAFVVTAFFAVIVAAKIGYIKVERFREFRLCRHPWETGAEASVSASGSPLKGAWGACFSTLPLAETADSSAGILVAPVSINAHPVTGGGIAWF